MVDLSNSQPFNPENISRISDTSGVHIVEDPSGAVVYVGRSGNQRRRLQQHLAGGRSGSVLHKYVGEMLDQELGREATRDEIRDWLMKCTFRYAEVDDTEPAKAELIELYSPRFNQMTYDEHLPGSEDGDEDPWDEFIKWCEIFYRTDSFEEDEVVYKLDIAEKLRAAKPAVEAQQSDWVPTLKRTFASNLTHYIPTSKFFDWVNAQPGRAAEAIAGLWDPSVDVETRLRNFEASLIDSPFANAGEATQIVSFLVMIEPETLPPFRPSAYKMAVWLTGFDRFSDDAGLADTYLHALGFLDEVIVQARERGLNLRHRLDAQSVVFAVTKGMPNGASAEMIEDLKRYRGEINRVWWVNQGFNYETERDHGLVTASLTDKAGRTPSHWLNVSLLRKGDTVVHYSGRALQAISKVVRNPVIGEPPTNPGEFERHWAKLRYWDLPEPIELKEIPETIRIEGGRGFNRKGGVNQGYLYMVSEPLESFLRNDLAGRWPVGSPWEGRNVNHWIFQGNPSVWEMDDFLDDISRGEGFNWVVSRYKKEIAIGDRVGIWKSGPEAGLYLLATVTSEVYEDTFDGDKTDLVDLVADQVLDEPIHRAALKEHPRLKEMTLITVPHGTNFRVTPEQWNELMSMIGSVEQPHSIVFVAETLDQVADQIRNAGFVLDDRVLRRYHHALSTRRFVILSGVSGTGKTWLAQLYADAIGAESKLVSVAPNWVSNEDLLGFYNPIDQTFHQTDFTAFLELAAEAYEAAADSGVEPIPYHVILDEMNLARVEYYFARFLSAMELVARDGVADVALDHERTVRIYDNLYFIGTVNVDETTHGFADKVYDRAQLVELTANRDVLAEHVEEYDWADQIMGIWDAVSAVKPFAFRVLDEVAAYIEHSSADDVPWQEALDDQILHKVLPKLAGGDDKLRIALEQVHERTNGTFPYSAAKARRMLDDLRDHGFTSYF